MAQIFYDNFDTDKTWVGYAGDAEWARGAPVQVTPAYSGTNCIATNLSTNYPDYIDPAVYLTSPTIDCLMYTGVSINFRRNAGFENNTDYDTFTVDAYNGSTWTTIWTSDDTAADIDDADWLLQTYSVSAYANNNSDFKVRFSTKSDMGLNFRGWFIDAFEVTGDLSTNFQVSGYTYDVDGDVISGCECLLIKDNTNNTSTVIDHTTSDSSSEYVFDYIADDDAQYYVYAWKDDTPHIFDVTDHVIQPLSASILSSNLYLRSDTDKGETSPDADLRLRSDADKLPVGEVNSVPQIFMNYRRRRI